jgi:hypothetical protein
VATRSDAKKVGEDDGVCIDRIELPGGPATHGPQGCHRCVDSREQLIATEPPAQPGQAQLAQCGLT